MSPRGDVLSKLPHLSRLKISSQYHFILQKPKHSIWVFVERWKRMYQSELPLQSFMKCFTRNLIIYRKPLVAKFTASTYLRANGAKLARSFAGDIFTVFITSYTSSGFLEPICKNNFFHA